MIIGFIEVGGVRVFMSVETAIASIDVHASIFKLERKTKRTENKQNFIKYGSGIRGIREQKLPYLESFPKLEMLFKIHGTAWKMTISL
ncbi:MAG: hypothetical protein JSS82_15815 [Bacteroidetes bacterium]|nr:hypothetical protein [Bacteroidota bacterium]